MSDPDDVTAASNESPPFPHLGPAVTSRHDGDTSHRIRPPGDVTTMTEPSGSGVTTPGDMEPYYNVPRRSDSAGSGDADDTTLKEVVEARIAGTLAPEHSTQGS